MSWYRLFKALGWLLTRSVARVHVEGRDHVPADGGFFLVPNHASALDPLFVQSSITRNDVNTLTKSSEFTKPLSGWALRRVRAFPVRRFAVDAYAFRTCLRLVAGGQGVCIFAEGERSWDGSLQPLQRGTVRLFLKAGVPVVPCGVVGSWDVQPRWTRRSRRHDVCVRFGPPIRWPQLDEKAEREAALPEAIRCLDAELRRLTVRPHEAALVRRGHEPSLRLAPGTGGASGPEGS